MPGTHAEAQRRAKPVRWSALLAPNALLCKNTKKFIMRKRTTLSALIYFYGYMHDFFVDTQGGSNVFGRKP